MLTELVRTATFPKAPESQSTVYLIKPLEGREPDNILLSLFLLP